MQAANIPDWRAIHDEIRADFGWSHAADLAAANKLAGLLPRTGRWLQVGTELKNRPVATVVGCANSLDSLQPDDLEGVIVAADGAAVRLAEMGVTPRVIVTDLDGISDEAAVDGSTVVVHAHGDNADALDRVPNLGPFVVGTHQARDSIPGLQRAAGFTDGDRAVLLCEAYHVRHIRLVAFDATAPPSVHSRASPSPTKSRKLAWMERILAGVEARQLVHLERT